MLSFFQFLESKQIGVQLNNYEKTIRQYINNFAINWNEKVEDHLQTTIDYNHLQSLLSKSNYPNIQQFIQGLKTDQGMDYIKQYYAWKQGKEIDPELFIQTYQTLRIVQDQLQKGQSKITPRREEEWIKGILDESNKNLEVVRIKLTEAISRIQQWNNSKITIIPYTDKENITEPLTAFTIKVNNADFTLFYHDDKLMPEDVLDYGDKDFFTDENTQTDYFTLIHELEKPGSTSGKGKEITLYTARPVSDREIYQQAADSGNPSVPAGIFLSNDPNHVEGIAADFGGRDIWKVKIDSNKVRITNDTPRVKYYQVIGSNMVPVKSLSLY